MTNKHKILNVLYQCNDRYAMVCGTSIASLMENNKHLDEINVYVCVYEVTKENINKFRALVARYSNSRLIIIEGKPYHEEFKKLKVPAWHGYYITWLKLLVLADISITTDRILYLDCHTIINGNLDELLTFNLGHNVMALSYDCIVNGHKQKIGLKPTDTYYNMGVMLVNHQKWIKESLSEKVKKHLARKSDYQIVDQDLCNVLFNHQIETMSVTYNFSSAFYAYDIKRLIKDNKLTPKYFYTYEAIMEEYYAPKIVHSLFGLKGKPWEERNEHPQRYLWDKYLKLTPWKDDPRPIARHSLSWLLYDMLPLPLFMFIYKFEVRRRFS